MYTLIRFAILSTQESSSLSKQMAFAGYDRVGHYLLGVMCGGACLYCYPWGGRGRRISDSLRLVCSIVSSRSARALYVDPVSKNKTKVSPLLGILLSGRTHWKTKPIPCIDYSSFTVQFYPKVIIFKPSRLSQPFAFPCEF